MAIILFNVALGFVVDANIFTTDNMYYESDMEDIDVSTDISVTDATEQMSESGNILSAVTSKLTFDWIKSLAPEFMRTNATLNGIVTSLNWFLGLLVGIATLEYIRGRWGVLGG